MSPWPVPQIATRQRMPRLELFGVALPDLDLDSQLRLAAFAALRSLRERQGGVVTNKGLDEGFTFGGERIAFRNPEMGIWRPRQLATTSGAALTVVTVQPRAGRPRPLRRPDRLGRRLLRLPIPGRRSNLLDQRGRSKRISTPAPAYLSLWYYPWSLRSHLPVLRDGRRTGRAGFPPDSRPRITATAPGARSTPARGAASLRHESR
jgi:hypothetical protein